jgi:hypothetical protein
VERTGFRITPDSINKEATVEGRLCGELRSFDLAQDRRVAFREQRMAVLRQAQDDKVIFGTMAISSGVRV